MSEAGPGRARRAPAAQTEMEFAVCDLYEQRISFNGLLGLKAEAPGGDPATARIIFGMRDDLVGHYLYGRLHGGVIASVLDAVGSFVLMLGIAERHDHESADQIIERFARMGTVDLRVDYLRQGTGAQFVASAEITRLGGRIASTIMRLHNEAGALIATGAATYIVS
jgi:uncharacterized protein (TIGR00369 family)